MWRVCVDGALGESGDARQDLIGTLGPDERLWIGLVGLVAMYSVAARLSCGR